MEQVSTYGTGLYASKWHGKPLSVLQITPPSVRRAASSQPTYDVSFELNWPTKNRGLSAPLQQLASGR